MTTQVNVSPGLSPTPVSTPRTRPPGDGAIPRQPGRGDGAVRHPDARDPEPLAAVGRGPAGRHGGPVLLRAGQRRSEREALERYQPMLSLHGHIYESRGEARIGRILAINL